VSGDARVHSSAQEIRAVSTYRLVVRSGGEQLGQGTGWLVGPTLVVTAFHVAGTLASRDWLHEGADQVEYLLMTSPPIRLTPLLFDAGADIALLQTTEPVPDPSVLGLAPAPARGGTPWHGRGYPGFEGGKPFPLSGSVVDFHIHDPSSEIQLLVEQGPQASWTGVSGTPICGDDGSVLGVITHVTDATDTGWGATAWAVQRLLQRWSARQAPDSRSSEIEVITCGTWRKLRSGIIQRLRQAGCRGVALLGPVGFGAHRVVDLIVTQLAQPREKLIPVRLVLDRSSTSEARLYRKLARDLLDGLARSAQVQDVGGCAHGLALARDTDGAWPADGRDGVHFALMVEKLVRGPLEERGCKLVLFVEGLTRMPQEHVAHWGALMKRPLDYGLELCLWDDRELRTLTAPAGNDDAVTAFHGLHSLSLDPWSKRDIVQLLEDRLGSQAQAVAETLEAVTGGHPALVRELLDLPAAVLERGDAHEIGEQLMGCTHMERLRREVEHRAELRRTLQGLASQSREPLPRKSWNEVELHWLGILSEVRGGWAWTAPVMRRLGV
jgi:hypothetical protein